MNKRIKKIISQYGDGFTQYFYIVIDELIRANLIHANIGTKDLVRIIDFFCYTTLDYWAPRKIKQMNLAETAEFFSNFYFKDIEYDNTAQRNRVFAKSNIRQWK